MTSVRLIQLSAAAVLMTAAISVPALATNNSDQAKNKDHKIGICHATGSKTNPYVYIVVDKHAAEAHKKHHDGRDVIGVSSADKCPKPAKTGSVLATAAPTPAAKQPTELPHTGAGLLSLLAASAAALGTGIYYRRRQA